MGSENQFLGATKAWLSIVFILFLGYVGINTFVFIKTKYKTEQADIFPIMPAFLKTLEIDLMPTMFIM